MVKITGLTIYPVKSCRGINVDDIGIVETGFEFDRQWVVVDEHGQFVTQRVSPRMALIHTALTEMSLILTGENSALHVPFSARGARAKVTVWNDLCEGYDAGDQAAEWLSDFLEQPVRLVGFDPTFQRLSNKQYTGDLSARNAYSDGFPILLISQASLDDLNSKLETPLPMNRFRPNIVIDGIDAFDEDYVAHFSRPGLRLKPVKPCTRCEITTTDQETAVRGEEPLLTLSKYRIDERLKGVTFGQNIVVAEGIGQRLRVGDELMVEWNF